MQYKASNCVSCVANGSNQTSGDHATFQVQLIEATQNIRRVLYEWAVK